MTHVRLNQIISFKPSPKPCGEEARPRIQSGHLDENAYKLLSQLSGVSHTDPFTKQKPTPPSCKYPRWIEALRDELVRAMLQSNSRDQRETCFLAGSLASFGIAAIPALVAALEEVLKALSAQSSGYRFKSVFRALGTLDSGAGIPVALALIERAQWMHKPVGFRSALDYLNDRPDPEVLPAIEKLLDRKLFGHP